MAVNIFVTLTDLTQEDRALTDIVANVADPNYDLAVVFADVVIFIPTVVVVQQAAI